MVKLDDYLMFVCCSATQMYKELLDDATARGTGISKQSDGFISCKVFIVKWFINSVQECLFHKRYVVIFIHLAVTSKTVKSLNYIIHY